MLIGGTIIWLALIGYIVWRYPHWKTLLLAISLPTYLLRFQIFGIPTTWLELTIYLVFIIWLYRNGLRTQWWRPLHRYWQPLSLLGIGLLIGTLISADPLVSLGILKGWFVDPLLLFLLIANSCNNPDTEFNYVVVGLWFSGVVLAVVALYQVASGDFITADQRASAWFGSANYLSLYLVPIMMLILGWWKRLKLLGPIKLIWPGWIIWGGWGLMLGALYFTFSYAGWLALLIGGLVFWWFTSPSWKAAVIGLIGTIIMVTYQWQSPKFQHLWDLAGRSSSHVRLQVWQTAFLMVKEHWFTGIGLGLFEARYLEFANRLFHPPLEPVMLHSHNIGLQFWLNTGILGLGGFIWLLSKWFRRIWLGVRAKNIPSVAVFSAMVALLAHGMVDVAYWKNDLSALFWIIVALGTILTQLYGRESLPDRN